MAEEKNKGGRPSLAKEDAKTRRITFLTTEAFYKQIEDAARKNHVPVSAFISAAVSEKVSEVGTQA